MHEVRVMVIDPQGEAGHREFPWSQETGFTRADTPDPMREIGERVAEVLELVQMSFITTEDAEAAVEVIDEILAEEFCGDGRYVVEAYVHRPQPVLAGA